jgi:Ser/Thr protein kinase RdoA (MazF antagonist)
LCRLRQLARVAINTYGMIDARLTFIQYGENIIYRVDLPGVNIPSSKSSPYLPNRYVLRIHATGDVEAISSELIWLAALDQQAGLPVPAPVSTPQGELMATILTPGIPAGRVVSLMRWLDGRRFREGFRPKHLTALGQVVAQMHSFSASWQPPAGFTRPHWDWEAQLGGSMFSVSLDELVDSMPTKYQQPFQHVSHESKQVMDALGKSSESYGLIHADLYPENVLYKAGKAYPIDFEDCGYGYWMWDIAVALCKWAWMPDWERMRDAFREGYTQIRTIPEVQWKHLDLFIATQFATMVLWASAFLKHDPKREAEYIPWRNDNGNKLMDYFNH